MAAAGLVTAAAHAQSIEPRAYSNAPVGVNFIVAGAAHTSGGLAFDPSLPIDNEHLRSTTGVFAYARTLGFQGERLADPLSLLATPKHFAGYGAAEGGLDYAAADVTERRRYWTPPRSPPS